MPPKTERFEMRLEEETLARVDHWRSKQDDFPSRAEAMRRLVELGLARASGETVRFSDGEKLLITMLGDIYKHLGVRGGEIDPGFVGEVIFGGHFWAPKWGMPGLFHDHEDDPREVRFVVDVLDMWDFLESGYKALPKAEKDRVATEANPFGKPVKFTGFDGNGEATLIGIARFFIEKMDRFTRFSGRDLNAHMPTMGRHREMLSVFEPMRKGLTGGELSATQIIAILNARVPQASSRSSR